MFRHELVPNNSLSSARDLSGPLYSAAGSKNLVPRFNFDGSSIDCAGAVYDSIRFLGPYEANFNNTYDVFLRWLSIVTQEFTPEDVNMMGPDNTDLMEAFWSMLAGDVAGVWGIEEEVGKDGAFKTVGLKQTETRH
jgi:hypothetical protein